MYNHQLDTFIQAADAGSFAKAAEALYISSTAVMKQINLLEGSLEVQLFNRTPRGLTLTDAGKSYYQDAKYMIQYAKDARIRAKNAMQSNESVIRIGTSLMTPSQFLMELWPQVHALNPKLKFEMVNFDNTPENAREILANLGRNIDLVAGVFDETMLALRACDAMELMRVPICCAVSIYHPLAQKKHVHGGSAGPAADADQAQLEQVCGPAPGRAVGGIPGHSNRGFLLLQFGGLQPMRA